MPACLPLRLPVLPLCCPQVSYSSSRNRQWHIYSVSERKNRTSLALKRVFLRWADIPAAAPAAPAVPAVFHVPTE